MKKVIDQLDIEIIKYLQDDSRRSLKKLADGMDQKTSTIYHRLQRLESNNVILGYSLILNPEYLDIKKMCLITLKVKPLNINSLDDMFIKSFANFLKTEFPNVLFISLSEDSKEIHLISVHKDVNEHTDFIKELQTNPYVEDIQNQNLSSIIKGHKIFDFQEDLIKTSSIKTDDDSDMESESLEISIDEDGDIEELKF